MILIKSIAYVLAAFRFLGIISTMALYVGVGLLLIKLKLADQNLAFRVRTSWCRLAIWILGIRLHTTGKIDLLEGSLFVGNHRSLIDPVIAFNFITNGYAVSKAEVSSYPLVHTGAVLSGVIYVERSNSKSRNQTRETIEKYLRENKSILIFPEGTISTDLKTLAFKKGSFEAAAAAQKQIVSFAIEMGNPKTDFWYEESLLKQYFKTFSKWKTDVYVHFFEPIKGNSGEELTTICQNAINQKLTEFQKNWN
ncbi:MAG: 1-acyl-sn-glycerol-3-phosphate acyltransferase [Saprospiraceae bacterium]|nr:1-acyl-sn-glycerol-3-phosphate acyltransferase [Saprospiraceae bacterium]MBK8484840.1 1-acyl-sn-glycerol-3-phosphate acyltransferase [Saprospiraceae bacterium]MBK9223331.1 1-acyl-sn-glycerol-3-phosphate acyltransferase [Saprospiraceae bacterium]MBK9720859.1 1-acyl-sn-glycerol-3-phosphate acyltransferase [Saprospiraceae bacterium]MBK9727855.1 1-acyl-sn-glycerol-3-phosphate acyltransferase [Saprospiraceae bacterium]